MQSVTKLIKIKPIEHKWVHNFLSVVKCNPDIKKIITSKQIDNYFMDELMGLYPEINNNHTYSILGWTIEMTKLTPIIQAVNIDFHGMNNYNKFIIIINF